MHNDQFKVAVIGMSGRFPGAKSLREYWQNLLGGMETIQSYTDDELLKMGVAPEYLLNPNFVRAGAPIPDRDLFAASFFGYSPREAELMDPQQRLFLECCWEALENAGYAPRSLQGQTGVYAGTSLSTYMLFNLLGHPDVHGDEDAFQVMIGNDKDFISTRVSYKLNLKGPSFTVQSGCSTGLTAIHLAMQNLLAYQCDTALAGGVSVGVPQRTGYHYEPNGIVSPDGHCRAFDADSAGTLFGEGVGVVVLKRLEDALRDRDFIYAVVLGTAINNDGSAKVGYTAPSIEGQAEVIAAAQRVAGVTADTISYVETHGTATRLGDPAEVSALTKAFHRTTTNLGFCGLGTVKSNIGHLDAAAGVAGFIKTVLMLYYKQLVPSLHFHNPNPKIDFAGTPFYVVTGTQEWKSDGLRRAGVSSFGIGGANVHAIVEEAPAQLPDFTRKPVQILSLSAQTETALHAAHENLLGFIETRADEALPDVAYTLHIGREHFKYRRSILCYGMEDAREALKTQDRQRVFSAESQVGPKVAFMFPGGGTQYPGMGRELYEAEPKFREQIDLCCSLLKAELGYDLRTLLYPSEKGMSRAAAQLIRPSAGLPAIFSTEYALAMLLISWGVRPEYMLGHSLGEYAAACLAGVFSLDAALSLVAFRGRLFENLSGGSMVSVYLSEADLHRLMNDSLSIAAINGPNQCVVSGPSAEIDNLCHKLSEQEIEFHRLHIDAAAHCTMVEPAMADFRRFLERLQLGSPGIPFVSNLTGTWITGAQACDPEYWVQHLRHTVRFADGLRALMSRDNLLALEVGPSRTLSSLAGLQCKERVGLIHYSLPHPQDSIPELLMFYKTLARMWNAGVQVDWQAFYAEEMRRRVPLPAYPFERERYWIAPARERKSKNSGVQRAKQLIRVYAPSWTEVPVSAAADSGNPQMRWVLLLDDLGIGESMGRLLEEQGERVVRIRARDRQICDQSGTHTVAINSETDFQRLFEQVLPKGAIVNLVHLWSLGQFDQSPQKEGRILEIRQKTIFSFLAVCKALGRTSNLGAIRFFAVSNGMVQVSGTEGMLPEKAAFASACRVAPQELENFSARVIEVALEGPQSEVASRSARQLLAEIRSSSRDPLVAYRGLRRWVPEYQLLPQHSTLEDKTPLRENGVYLITGGAGSLGPVIANSFAARQRCQLVLIVHSPFPSASTWENWLQSHSDHDRTSQAIRMFREIEAKGSTVTLVTADISSEADMNRVFAEVRRHFGSLHGVVHLAGITGAQALRLIPDLVAEECERQFSPKINGCYVLSRLLQDVTIDFCVLFSSTASVLGGAGMTAYAAANGFLDAFAVSHYLNSGQKWFSINWDGWITDSSPAFMGSGKTGLDRFAISSEEGVGVLHRILGEEPGQYIVSRGEIETRIQDVMELSPSRSASANGTIAAHVRPTLASDYVAPATPLQRDLAAVWAEVLGVDKVGLHDNLFELGGNSLIGLRIISKLKRTLGIDIPVIALFEGPTVFALSKILDSTAKSNDYQSSRRRGDLRRQRVAGSRLAGSTNPAGLM